MGKKTEKEVKPTMRAVADALERYAYRSGQDAIKTWNEWLEWLCVLFDIGKMDLAADGDPLHARFEWGKKDNPDFFDAAAKWLDFSYRELQTRGPSDALGEIYEGCFQAKGKADSLGQFFTPMHICRLMAGVCGTPHESEDGIVHWNDPAVGSGRTLIAGWGAADKYAKNYFEGGDIDATSVRMTALNMMINGMVGTVHCQNCLSREWRFGYVVNACKVPFANNFAALEFVGDEKTMAFKRGRLLELMQDWDVGRYRPETDTKAAEAAETRVEAAGGEGGGGEADAPAEDEKRTEGGSDAAEATAGTETAQEAESAKPEQMELF